MTKESKYLTKEDSWHIWEFKDNPELLDLYDPVDPFSFIAVQHELNKAKKR